MFYKIGQITYFCYNINIGGGYMELYAQDLFFRGNTEKEQTYDCCVHGKVIFKIDDTLLSDETEWCISASAYRFLHTLFENHFMGTEDFLIPCCGHTMIPTEDKNAVNIIGCSNGIDFNIIHQQGNITITTEDNTEYQVPFAEYKNAVLAFAKQMIEFYKSNPPREFEDDFDKDGYSAFVAEWYKLYDKAVALQNDTPTIRPITFEDYDACTENEIMGITEYGISLKSFHFINFKECAYNFQQTEGGTENCVGEKETSDLSYTFYTSPKPIMIKFIEKSKFIELVSKENTISRFNNLQNKIVQYGYTTKETS